MTSPLRLTLLIRLLLLSALHVPAHAAAAHSRPICLQSCTHCLKTAIFEDGFSHNPAAEQFCRSQLKLTSLYLCMDLHCRVQEREYGVELLSSSCEEKYDVSVPRFEDVVSGYTDEDVARLHRVEFTEEPKKEIFEEAVVPTGKYFRLWFGTLDAVEYVRVHDFWYAWAMGIFWIVVVAIGMGSRFLSHITHRRILLHPQRRHETMTWALIAWIRRRFLVPATFGYRSAQNFGWATVPPRVQTLTIAAFTVMNVAFCVQGYQFFNGNIYYPTITLQVLRYVSDRTGIISFANFPIIWLFGMRNNVVIWMTGWDFGTYNNFHRWAARIATVQAVVHSIGYTVLILKEGGWSYFVSWWVFWFWWAGQMATVGMCFIVGLSFYWMRRQQYELFLVLHVLLSILVLLTMLGHVSIFSGQYDAMFWIPAFIWILDRLLRVCRVLAFNPKVWDTRGRATYDPSSNIVRLTIPTSTSVYTVAAGTHFYLMVLGRRFWESHPFTVASLSSRMSAAKTLDEQEEPLLASPSMEDLQDTDDRGEMTFLIRPYDSFTLRLKEQAEAEWPRAANLRVLVDGPYGHTRPFHLFDRTVFVVGGSGIVVALSYLRSLAATQREVEIHWAVREPGFADEVLRRDCGDLLGSDCLTVKVYITSSTSVPRREGEVDFPNGVEMRRGRLNAGEVVHGAKARTGAGSLAVVACGPARVADDTRQAVVRVLGVEKGWVEYFEESFQW